MQNPRLAIRYAKSLIDLSIEQNQLELICNDMKLILIICKSNPDFVAVLKSPIIKSDKKGKIIEAVTNDKVSKLSSIFIQLLIKKGRESNFPEIAQSFVTQYNQIKNIRKAKLITAVPISDEIKNSFIANLKALDNVNEVEMETFVDESLIGGFILETDDKLIDGSILRDLKDIKKQFMNNDYLHKLR